MSDLAAFLTARIGEDEAWARSYARLLNETQMNNASTPEHERASVAFVFGQEHLHPGRLLREAEVKRKILAEHPPVYGRCYYEKAEHWGCPTCHDDDGVTAHPGHCETVLALAAVYSDHPDYLEEWP